jgi:hypothetical protein
VAAQTAGDNAVYGASGITFSSAFLDASRIDTTRNGAANVDICALINDALYTARVTLGVGGVTIDARGVTSLTCPSGSTPWAYVASGTTHFEGAIPATVLLPAGTILTNNAWILPNRTRIIGEGSGAGSSVTTIRAQSPFSDADSSSPATVVRMGTIASGNSLACSGNCFAVGVEDLRVDGNNISGLNGITNLISQEQSYVNRVTIYRATGTALQIGSSSSTLIFLAQNSGPYSDVAVLETAPSTGTQCAQILDSPTRGIHGISCVNTGTTTPSAAIYLDGASNTIEDTYISGFSEGIVVGQNADASDSTIINTVTSTATFAVHICKAGGTACSGSSDAGALDVALMGTALSNCPGTCNTIQDDATGVGLSSVPDHLVAIYILGEAFGGGYSRFTTSTKVPTWIVGGSAPSGSCVVTGITPNGSNGSLYSNTNGGSGGGSNTFYVCVNGTWTDVK